jgi:hypothetical protein
MYLWQVLNMAVGGMSVEKLRTDETDDYEARFEVLTAVLMKSSFIWDMTPCSPLKVNIGKPLRFLIFGRWAYIHFDSEDGDSSLL